MGCDIHLHIEVKLNGTWEHLNHIRPNRNYRIFQVMAGVRGDEETPISLPKGLPPDLTAVTLFDAVRWRGDAHSHSWLGAREISVLSAWMDAHKMDLEYDWLHCYLFGNSFAGFIRYPDDQPEGLEDVRFVFWFDN